MPRVSKVTLEIASYFRGADGSHIAEQLAPVFHRPIRSQQRAESFVAAHHDFQQILGGSMRQLAHAEVVEDEQRNGGYQLHVLFTRAICDGIGQLIQQDMDFAIQNFIAL